MIILGAAIALINDLPAMLLSVSRLMFAWAEDAIFPRRIAAIHHTFHTPYVAILLSGFMASFGILGSHFAGDFFLGIDIMVTSMMVNFLLMCVTFLNISTRNPELGNQITTMRNTTWRKLVSWAGICSLVIFLTVHTWKDLSSPVGAWYLRSTPIWLIVLTAGSALYYRFYIKLKASGVDVKEYFSKLPPT